jgi:hypothetical protein
MINMTELTIITRYFTTYVLIRSLNEWVRFIDRWKDKSLSKFLEGLDAYYK